jgi:DnaK suppressor protein
LPDETLMVRRLPLFIQEPPLRHGCLEGAISIMTRAGRKATTTVTSDRYHELKRALHDRRRELEDDLHGKMREARSASRNEGEVLDTGESSEVEMQDAIDFALIEMKAETLAKIDTALGRLDEGTYGVCFDCGQDISQARLRALPFALRCRDCEEVCELTEQRRMAQGRDASSPFFNVRNSLAS